MNKLVLTIAFLSFAAACGEGIVDGNSGKPDAAGQPDAAAKKDASMGRDVEAPPPDAGQDAGQDAGPHPEDAAKPPTFCTDRADGDWCDGADLVKCAGEAMITRTDCPEGCDGLAGPGRHKCASPRTDFCEGKMNGAWCDGDDLVMCRNDRVESRSACPNGCVSMPVGTPDKCREEGPSEFCEGKMNGAWCDADDLVMCRDDGEASRQACPSGCVQKPPGVPDECAAEPFCTDVPSGDAPVDPADTCNWMEWNLDPDGFYLISRFGTSEDDSTWGNGTSCGYLRGHYDYHQCRYDNQSGGCLPGDFDIPWVQDTVDYDYDEVAAAVDAHMDGDVPAPEYFYVADGQRFNCGMALRVSNPSNGRCVVAYTEDGGPGSTYEGPEYGGRRILDASPAVSRYLQVARIGWSNSDKVYVEWGLPGDVPGHACVACQSTPAQEGTENMRSPFDLDHMMPTGRGCR